MSDEMCVEFVVVYIEEVLSQTYAECVFVVYVAEVFSQTYAECVFGFANVDLGPILRTSLSELPRSFSG